MENNIVLGIFKHIWRGNYNEKASEYPFYNILDKWLINEIPQVMDVVKVALSRCETCYFVIDGLLTPLDDCSCTCRELLYILANPILLDKVVFMSDNKEISHEEAFKHLSIKL